MPVPAEIERAFLSGATIVTSTARAARWLHREYGLRQRAAGRRAWTTPPIADWESWVRQQWQVAAEDGAPLLLTSLQERSVWTRMQREDAALVVSPASMATLAESAYALLSAYRAQDERRTAWGKADAERFRQWALSFDRECARRNWMPRAGLEEKLAARMEAGAVPEEVVLLGFDRVTPAQDALLRALEATGARVSFATMGNNASTEYVRAAGLRDEIAACAEWARRLLEQNQEIRIGVLAPDVGAVRAEMERVFRRVLMPESQDVFAGRAMPFEFSLGLPLAHTPVTQAALLLLRWLHTPLWEEELSWLLLSDFVEPDAAQRMALARLDAASRNSGTLSLEISLESLLKQASKWNLPAVERLRKAHRAAMANHLAEEERLPSRWTDLVQSLLFDGGWPGGAIRGTLHFQALRRWERVLDEVALLDFDGQRMRYSDFLHALEAHALETIFAPESQGAPVQIMGALEASGQQFDAVWFLGVDDTQWPMRGRPQPLLPNSVQRRLGMPYADPVRELELAETITARIAGAAPVVVFSYAERNEDGELRASPLLPRDATWQSAEVDEDHMLAPALEVVEEPAAQLAWPQDRSAGGSEVLKEQAACPFRAFAGIRLGAEPLNRREWGLSAAERGKLLHKALENIWHPEMGALHSLADLQAAMKDERLEEILSEAIAKAFTGIDADSDVWMSAYLRNEQRRLRTRLGEWMEMEGRRVPFTVIACEKTLPDVDVGGLRLKLRADRMDEVANGERLLIDYKSGGVSQHDWDAPRPDEPQVPLYAVFGGVEQLCGALFARIRAGKTAFIGSVEDLNRQMFAEDKPTATLGKLVYGESLRDAWQEALVTLATDFLRGEAAVDPKRGAETCKYCSLPGLCRVAERTEILDAEVEDDDRD